MHSKELGSHNFQSTPSAEKLESLFNDILTLTVSFPFSGQLTDMPNVRIRIIKHFKLVYRITDTTIEILTVWDTRQDPKALKF